MHLPLLQKAMKLWWFNSLFKQHPSHNSLLRFPLKLSSTHSSSPSVWAACWSPSWPWKCTLWWCRTGSYQAKAAESSLWGKKGVLTSEADLVTGPIGSATKTTASNVSKPHPPTQELRYSDILFLFAPERLSCDGQQITAASTDSLNLTLETELCVCRAAMLKIWLLSSSY